MEQAADIEFPKEDTTNPEIERMWAWHRIDALLKTSDAPARREQVIPEIVRLGEEFSIVTEYTSFLVLENDAEFQRWKIERRNAARLARDRQSQAVRETALTALRQKAVADLGPQPASPTRNRSRRKLQPSHRSRNAPIAQTPEAPRHAVRAATSAWAAEGRRLRSSWPAVRSFQRFAGPSQTSCAASPRVVACTRTR